MKNKNTIVDYLDEEIKKINKESIKTDFLLGKLTTLQEIKFKIEETK